MTEHQQYQGEKLPPPDRILVYDFTANPADVPPESAFVAEHAVARTGSHGRATRNRPPSWGAEVAKQIVARLRNAACPQYRLQASLRLGLMTS